MSTRRAAFLALGVVAALLGWLLFAVGDRPEDGSEDPALSVAEEAAVVESETEEEDPDLEPAPELDAGAVEATRTVEANDHDLLPESAATAIPTPSADSAAVRGLLRDAATGELLPQYALRIQDATGRWEDVMTDESGRFTTGSPMVGGRIRITPFDEPSHRRSLPVIAADRTIVAGEASDLDLSVPCGPTYRLSITPAGMVVPTTLVANLTIQSLDNGASLGPEPLRAGDPPWVRFGPAPKDYERCDRIEIRDKQGIWQGSAKVSALSGIVPGFVDLVLDARAVLLGKAVDREGHPVPGASVVFEGMAASGKTYERRASTRADGQFRIEFLAAGSGTVSVRSLRHVGQDAAIRLPAGAFTQQDFILEPLPPAGAIGGRLESETGSYDADVEVVLRPQSGTANPERQKVRWEERSGRKVGVFQFEALPAGEYEIAVRSGGWFGWEPSTLIASPPSGIARFVVRDDLAHADFAIRARDADNGAGLDAVFASWSVRGGTSDSRRIPSGEKILTRFPLERSFRWRVDRYGYQPAFGDEKGFAVEEQHEGGLWRIAEIDLRPGWGEVFRVVGRGKQKPIEGAKILLDGREAGTTNKNGTCTVLARERPKRVEVAYRDWRLVSSIDLRPAWRRKEKRFVEVQVAPPPKN